MYVYAVSSKRLWNDLRLDEPNPLFYRCIFCASFNSLLFLFAFSEKLSENETAIAISPDMRKKKINKKLLWKASLKGFKLRSVYKAI